MLKTNSKKARENVKQFIRDNAGIWYLEECAQGFDLSTDKGLFSAIWHCCETEKFYQHYKSLSEQFADWCAGLPSALCCNDVFLRPVVPVVARILEETPAEAARFSEDDAEKLMISLMFREIIQEVRA